MSDTTDIGDERLTWREVTRRYLDKKYDSDPRPGEWFSPIEQIEELRGMSESEILQALLDCRDELMQEWRFLREILQHELDGTAELSSLVRHGTSKAGPHTTDANIRPFILEAITGRISWLFWVQLIIWCLLAETAKPVAAGKVWVWIARKFYNEHRDQILQCNSQEAKHLLGNWLAKFRPYLTAIEEKFAIKAPPPPGYVWVPRPRKTFRL